MVKRVLPFVLALLFAPPAWARDCSIARANFVFGSDSETTMVAKSGVRCAGRINERLALASGEVAQNAAHGTASINEHIFSYQSRPGYTGQDNFVLALSGTTYARGRSGSLPLDGTTHMNVSVQVTP